MTYEEASGFWKTSQTDFEYDEAMCVTMPDPTIGKIKAKKRIHINLQVHSCALLRFHEIPEM
jgi:hypothetical protein